LDGSRSFAEPVLSEAEGLRMTGGCGGNSCALTPPLSRREREKTVDCRLLTVDLYQLRQTVQVEVDQAFAGVFDARGKRVGDFEEGFLGGAFAFEVAGAGEELGEEGAGLREGHAGLEAFFARLAGGGDDAGGVAVAFEDGDGFAFEVRLAAQARGQREEGDVEAGEH
jgi:hypothetical protein